jgi:peptidyl-prolyl cis-trans isomerase C
MKPIPLLFCTLAALPALAQNAVPPATPLIANGVVVITAEDFEANQLRIPENMRNESRANLERVSQMSDNLFINRMLAEEARKAGLDKDPLVQARARQLIDTYLAGRYLEEYERTVKMPDLTARAREIYVSEAQRFRVPESCDIDNIVVGEAGRTREMALERAKEVERRIRAGEDFFEVARIYNEETRPRGIPGKLGLITAGSIDPALFDAAMKLPVGAVSTPIATKSGYHVIRVNAKTPARQLSFEDVREGIIADERAKIAKRSLEDKVQGYRSDPATKVDKEAMEKLVQDIPREQIDKLLADQAEKIRAVQAAKKAEAAKRAEAEKK